MSRLRVGAFLIGALQISSCGKPVAPVGKLTAEEQAATGTYTLTLANGQALPVNIGRFISSSSGSNVAVTGATLKLSPDTRTRSEARLTVTVEYTDSDPIQGIQRRNGSGEARGPWSLSGSTLSFQAADPLPTFVLTAWSISGSTITVTTTSPGLYGAVSPTVVLTLAKQ